MKNIVAAKLLLPTVDSNAKRAKNMFLQTE